MRVAIVGGGIGGLAAAIGLKQAGQHVTVFERAEEHPSTGTGLGIWPSALRALDRLGLGARARQLGRRQPSGAIHRPDGTRIAAIDVDRIERRSGDPVYLLSRPVLLNLLASASGDIKFGHGVDDPSSLIDDYDVVVGADGIHSGVRRMMFGDAYPLRPAGVTIWRGTVDADSTAAGEWWGRGMKFGVTPQEPGRTNWYAAVSSSINGDPWSLFAGWADPIPLVLERAAPAETLHHELSDLTPLPGYVKGNCVLIGDAAHAMTPELGQGACQAIIDGVALADCLSSGRELSTFDRLRRPPTQRLAAISARMSRLSLARRFLPLRDTAIRLALSLPVPS